MEAQESVHVCRKGLEERNMGKKSCLFPETIKLPYWNNLELQAEKILFFPKRLFTKKQKIS